MARPKKPIPLATDLTRTVWENTAGCLDRARELSGNTAVREIVTVLVNERPSALGFGTIDFVQGYEHCLANLIDMLKGKRRQEPEPEPPPDYSSQEAIKELGWEQ